MTDTTTSELVPTRRKRKRRQKYAAERLAPAVNVADLPPAVRALTEKQRRFVLELHYGPNPGGYGSIVRAARAAGLGTATSSDISLRNSADAILYHPAVQSALRELGPRAICAAAVESIANIRAIAANPKHKDHFKANLALLSHGFPAETHHTVEVKKTPEMVLVATEEVLERIRLLALKAGLDPVKQIEAVANQEESS